MVSLSVSVPLIMIAMNLECCSRRYRDFRYDCLALIGIKLIDRLQQITFWPRFMKGDRKSVV